MYPGQNNHDDFFEKAIYPIIREIEVNRFLEVGCGSGAVLRDIARLIKCKEICAIDRNKLAVEQAKNDLQGYQSLKFFNKDFISDNLDDMGTFDFVHCQGVLHHFSDIKLGVKKLRSLTNEQGFLYVWVYNKAGRSEITRIKQFCALTGSKEPESLVNAILDLKKLKGHTTKHKKYISKRHKNTWLSKAINFMTEWERYGFKYAIKSYGKRLVSRLFGKDSFKKQLQIGLADEYFNPQEHFFSTSEFINLMESEGLKMIKIVDGISADLHELCRGSEKHEVFFSNFKKNQWDLIDLIDEPRGVGALFQRVR